MPKVFSRIDWYLFGSHLGDRPYGRLCLGLWLKYRTLQLHQLYWISCQPTESYLLCYRKLFGCPHCVHQHSVHSFPLGHHRKLVCQGECHLQIGGEDVACFFRDYGQIRLANHLASCVKGFSRTLDHI